MIISIAYALIVKLFSRRFPVADEQDKTSKEPKLKLHAIVAPVLKV